MGLDGAWVTLTPDTSGRPAHRYDGRASYCSDQRVRLSSAILAKLELVPGNEVAIIVLPRHGAIALCNPSWLCHGAPLALLTTPAPDVVGIKSAKGSL